MVCLSAQEVIKMVSERYLDYLKFLADMEKEGKMTEFFKGEQYICLETLDMFRLWPSAKEFLPDDLEARFPL